MYTIVYFWADWCPLCKSFKKEFIAELVPYFNIEAVNVSEEPYKATKHKITKLPWAILVKDGEVIEKSVSYKDLFRIIEKYGGKSMKIEFTAECHDKNTGVEYKKGDTAEYAEERAKEIIATGYAVAVEEEAEAEAEAPKENKKSKKG